MRVSELWRYPVKSLRGESLDEVLLTEFGIESDRLIQAVRPDGRVFTARTHPGMLGLRGGIDENGVPTVDGVRWDHPDALAAVRAVTESDAELVWYDGAGPQRFDVLPISLATDGGVAAVGVDRRRFRANVYLSGVPGLAERDWVGREVRVGDAILGVRQVRGRCVMTTFDPDTLEQDIGVLQKIVRELGGRTALDCYVLRPGWVQVGDDAEVGDYWRLARPAPAESACGAAE
jgi:MOSC domain-containing protein